METSTLVPPWLETLLSTTFFSTCEEHFSSPRNECNMYCLDCEGHAFCLYCRLSRHNDHQVIQIRRSSYHDVVRVADIQNALDISEVQTYVINSARVFFLNERPQANASSAKSSPHICEICRRNLLESCRFCSLGCKLAGIKKNGDASFVLGAKKEEEKVRTREETVGRLPSEEEELRKGIIHKQVYQSTPSRPQACSNSRRRKGIPHRAPLRS